MMDVILYLVVVAIAGAFIHSRFQTASLTGLTVLAGVVLSFAVFFGSMWISATSYEIISGTVTGKEVVYDPTTESYDCGKDSQGNTKTCTRTVPRWRFDVLADVGRWYDYSYTRSNAPTIYTRAVIGEPFAKTKFFMNYQYVNDESSIYNKHDQYAGWLPSYPDVYDGYKIRRALSNTVNMNDMNDALAKAQQVWGKKYGVNVIVAVVGENDDLFADALRSKWTGGKKNDAVLILFVDDKFQIVRARVFSRSTSNKVTTTYADFNITLRENAARIGFFDPAKVVAAINESLPFFEREDLSEHDYGAANYTSPWWVNVLGSILIVAAMFGVAVKLGGRFMPLRSRMHLRRR